MKTNKNLLSTGMRNEPAVVVPLLDYLLINSFIYLFFIKYYSSHHNFIDKIQIFHKGYYVEKAISILIYADY